MSATIELVASVHVQRSTDRPTTSDAIERLEDAIGLTINRAYSSSDAVRCNIESDSTERFGELRIKVGLDFQSEARR